MTPKTLIYTCLHYRHEVTRIWLESCYKLPNTEVFAVITEGDTQSAKLCDEFGAKYVFHKNSPLGAKRNRGLREIIGMDFDIFVDCGSDDILTEHWYKMAIDVIGFDNKIYGFTSAYVTKLGTDKAAILKYGSDKILGSGAFCTRKDLINAIRWAKVRWVKSNCSPYNGWKIVPLSVALLYHSWGEIREYEPIYRLWDDELNRGLDRSRDTTFACMGNIIVPIPHGNEVNIVSIKSDNNIWTWERLLKIGQIKECSFETIKQYLPCAE